MKYDPDKAPDAAQWLALDEADRTDMVLAAHEGQNMEMPSAMAHSGITVAVENQLAEGLPEAVDALARLQAEGLGRHDAVHAIGLVLAEHLWRVLRDPKSADPTHEPYLRRLRKLTKQEWLDSAD